jgi:Sulfotransferase family
VRDADALLQRATDETGLTDLGDETLAGRLRLVVELIDESDLGAEGEAAAEATIHGLLTSRLGFFEDRKRYPLAQEEIARPIFATGEPRSGTTLLHALLAVDPNARALRFWEVMHPSPPPGPAGPDDRRRAQADDEWRAILRRIPPWIVSHPYNDELGGGLPECERTWAFDFRSMVPSIWWRVPMLMRPALPQDHATQYGIHRMVLQHVQHTRPRRNWVLKGWHTRRLAALFDTYPDACIVWVHRDPVQVIASQITAFGQINECLAGSLDWDAWAEAQLDTARRTILANLDDPLVDDPRIHHVRYPDFARDPVATIGRFYERYGIPFTAEAETAMRRWLADNPGDRHGKFVYSTDVLPGSVDVLDDTFAAYRERFGLDERA